MSARRAEPSALSPQWALGAAAAALQRNSEFPFSPVLAKTLVHSVASLGSPSGQVQASTEASGGKLPEKWAVLIKNPSIFPGKASLTMQ